MRNATQRIPEPLRERFKFHIQQLPKVVQEILKYVSHSAHVSVSDALYIRTVHCKLSVITGGCRTVSFRLNFIIFFSFCVDQDYY